MLKTKKEIKNGRPTGLSVNGNKRSYVSQSDIPCYSLEEALRIPRAINENYAFKPVKPIQLAQGVQLTPTSSIFKMLCGASIAYGLTEGGYNATEIIPTELAKRILKPKEEGDELKAKREAFLKPRIIADFLNKYNGNLIPKIEIACNVLEEFGAPRDKTTEIFNSILSEGSKLGLIKEIKGKSCVDLSGTDTVSETETDTQDNKIFQSNYKTVEQKLPELESIHQNSGAVINSAENQRKKRVYVSHGKDTSFIDPIKKLLRFGEMEAIVSIEKQSVSKPVPDKVMAEMRNCGAAIIHVDAEQKLIDKELKEHVVLNPNVLIEIGAAMALYGRRFILLVKNGITLPSNLQGLYEVRYDGEELSGDVTIKLLEAINDIKNQNLPD